jgi:hypothetical protein
VKSYQPSSRYLSMENVNNYQPQKFLGNKLSILRPLFINGKYEKVTNPLPIIYQWEM